MGLRHIDLHIYNLKFKCEGLHIIREFVFFFSDHFVFSFDLKSGYNHVDIFPEHRKFLSFSWDSDEKSHSGGLLSVFPL